MHRIKAMVYYVPKGKRKLVCGGFDVVDVPQEPTSDTLPVWEAKAREMLVDFKGGTARIGPKIRLHAVELIDHGFAMFELSKPLGALHTFNCNGGDEEPADSVVMARAAIKQALGA